jgi:hypothetical protein
MMSDKPYNILFLADTGHHTAAVQDHIHALKCTSPHHWHIENPLTCKTLHKLDLSQFDAIGIHYSIRPYNPYYLPRPLYKALKHFDGVKFQFLQDEYQRVNTAIGAMQDLGINILFTLVRPELVDKAYPNTSDIQKVVVHTAYAPKHLLNLKTPAIKDRQRDIFYRSRENEYWLGALAQDKIRIAEGVSARAEQYDLNIDVSVREEDRVYGQAWLDNLLSAKAVLATESGASIWDFDGSVEERTRDYLAEHPKATFDETLNAVLKDVEGNVMYSAISPRIFEAAACRTPLVMFPGWYSGICEADKHYIKLEKDFSNFDEVVQKLQDDDYLQALADRTYADLIASDKYAQEQLSAMVNQTLEDLIAHEARAADVDALKAAINANKREHRHLNRWYILNAEAKFAVGSVFKIVCDKRYSAREKLGLLSKGFERYWTYLLPRYAKSKKPSTL